MAPKKEKEIDPHTIIHKQYVLTLSRVSTLSPCGGPLSPPRGGSTPIRRMGPQPAAGGWGANPG